MNTKAVIPLIAGLGIAGVAGKLGYDYVKKAQGAQTQRVQLWAVMEDVPRGQSIQDADLRPIPFPAELAPKTAFTDKQKLIGRVPHTGVPAGVPVLETMLLPPGTSPGVHVPPGLRAVAVKIDESSGVDNHLQPGCRVDVVGYFTVKNAGNRNETIARTIVENVEVAAVGQRLAPEVPERPSADAKAKKSAPSREKPARAVTLLVTPEQVPALLIAEHRGEIKLSMRGSEDKGNLTEIETVHEGEVTGLVDPNEKKAVDAEKGGGLAGWMENLFGPKPKTEPEPPVAQAEPVAEPEPAKPEYIAMMKIVNGSEMRTVGWTKDHPDQPVDISPDGQNIFEQQPGGGHKSKKPGKKGEAKPGTETPGSPGQTGAQKPGAEKKAEPAQPESEEEEIIPASEEEPQQPKELIG